MAHLPACPPSAAPTDLPPLSLVALHACFIVIDKPAGLLAVPGRGADKQDCLAARVQARWPEALVVHRLDQATSGLMLFARDLASQRTLSAAFAARALDKRYIAVVAGWLGPESGSVDAPLGADWPRRPLQRVDPVHGKPSLTHWRVLERRLAEGARGGPTTRLELRPVSGRSHQLRVHLHSIGHAILGDALYADPGVCEAAPRLLLHASELAFADPTSGAAMHFISSAPF